MAITKSMKLRSLKPSAAADVPLDSSTLVGDYSMTSSSPPHPKLMTRAQISDTSAHFRMPRKRARCESVERVERPIPTTIQFPQIFHQVEAVFNFCDGRGDKRGSLLCGRFTQRGGTRSFSITNSTTHVICHSWLNVIDLYWQALRCPFRKTESPSIRIVGFEWICACMSVGFKVPEHHFLLDHDSSGAVSQLEIWKNRCWELRADKSWHYLPERDRLY